MNKLIVEQFPFSSLLDSYFRCRIVQVLIEFIFETQVRNMPQIQQVYMASNAK